MLLKHFSRQLISSHILNFWRVQCDDTTYWNIVLVLLQWLQWAKLCKKWNLGKPPHHNIRGMLNHLCISFVISIISPHIHKWQVCKHIWPHQLEKKVRNKWYWIFFIWRKYIEYLHSTHQLQWPNLVKNIISCNIWDLRNGSILCLAVVPTLRWPVIRHPPFLLQQPTNARSLSNVHRSVSIYFVSRLSIPL